jgi:hypothetical protein
MVDRREVGVVAEGGVAEVGLLLEDLGALAQHRRDLLEDGQLALGAGDPEDVGDRALAPEGPGVEAEEEEEVEAEAMGVELELAAQREPLGHEALEDVGEVGDPLRDPEGHPHVLVLVPLDREPVPQQQTSV